MYQLCLLILGLCPDRHHGAYYDHRNIQTDEMEAKAEDPEPLLEAKTQSDWAIDGSSVWSTDGSSCLQAGELDLERCVLSQ